MSTFTPLFGTSTSITVDAASVASGSCISANAIDCEAAGTWTVAPDDIILGIEIVYPNLAPSGSKVVNLYFAPSEDGTHYADNDQYSGTANAPTLESPTNWFGPVVIPVRQNAAIYAVTPRISTIFGGLPRKFGVIFDNESGNAIDNSGGAAILLTATPINETV